MLDRLPLLPQGATRFICRYPTGHTVNVVAMSESSARDKAWHMASPDGWNGFKPSEIVLFHHLQQGKRS